MLNDNALNYPIALKTSRAWRTYIGGKYICRLHNEPEKDDNFPEEWLMSTICARNSGREGLNEGMSLAGAATLKELIEKYPQKILGKKHFEKYGTSTGVLVKLLDSAERLTVQVHPDRETAKRLFDSDYGKTECWHILDSRVINGEQPCIYIGFKEGITREKWKSCFDRQDIKAMLECLHRFTIKKGDTVIIRGGVPHAIGSGCFLCEIQEPTDYTIRTERVTPHGLTIDDFMCHQGLGFDKMFDCFIYDGVSRSEAHERWFVTPQQSVLSGGYVTDIIYSSVTDMFSLRCLEIAGDMQLDKSESFYGLYVLSGQGKINEHAVSPGAHFIIPAECDVLLSGYNFKLLKFTGPN